MICQIPDEHLDRVQQAIRSFEADRKKHGVPPFSISVFERFLPPPSNAAYCFVAYELVAIDLSDRWAKKESVWLERYVAMLPEIGSTATLPVELIAAEHKAARAQNALASTDYKKRFPNQFASLMQLVKRPASGTLHRPDTWSPTPSDLTGTLVDVALEPQSLNVNDVRGTQSRAVDGTSSDETIEEAQVSTGESSGNVSVSSGSGLDAASKNSSTARFTPEVGYQLVRRIGEGSFGEVWLAEAPGGVEVALKMLRFSSGHQMSQIELRALHLMKRLRHSFLLQVQAFWVRQDQILIAMELADKSLRDLAQSYSDNRIPIVELLAYFREAAEGIDFLHREHVLHRDIKPENLLVLNGHMKVADFGLAKFLDDSRMAMTATQQAGSPLYMAPEVWGGKLRAESDQYSLAMSYAELRMGRAPFASTSLMQVMQAHLNERPDIEEVPSAERKVLLRAMNKKPEARFETCIEMIAALEHAVALDSGLIEPKKASLTLRAAVLFTLLAIVSIASAIIAYRSTSAPPPLTRPPVAINVPKSIALPFGSSVILPVNTADRSDEIESLAIDDLPAGVELKFENGQAAIAADLDAMPQNTLVHLVAGTNRGKVTTEFELQVLPSDKLVVPAGMSPSSDAKRIVLDGRIFYNQLEKQVSADYTLLARLIPRQSFDDPPTFYMFEQEISNLVFRVFADQQKIDTAMTGDWKLGALAGDQRLGSDGTAIDLPVVDVTVSQASRFATWLGGTLPTVAQWDKAAGANLSGRSNGPYISNGSQLCINRLQEGPVAVGTSRDDISPFGIRDMAGNVSEWTRDIFNSSQRVPLDNSLGSELVLVRGNCYYDTEPWQYSYTADNLPQTLQYDESSPKTGIRVVIDAF